MLRVDISIAGTTVRSVFVHGQRVDESNEDVIARLKASIVVSLAETDPGWRPNDPILVLSPRLDN